MRLAEKFGLPLFTFIDTPGAYPGIGAEERGQSEAIGRNLFEMAGLRVPIVCTVIGEGGSGGALAIAVGDALLMLQYATYSVISPEGCASILWKSAERAPEAAESLGITALRLKSLGLIDKIVPEPLGGAHRDPATMNAALKRLLTETLKPLAAMPVDETARGPPRTAALVRQVQRDCARLTSTVSLRVRPRRNLPRAPASVASRLRSLAASIRSSCWISCSQCCARLRSNWSRCTSTMGFLSTLPIGKRFCADQCSKLNVRVRGRARRTSTARTRLVSRRGPATSVTAH